MKKFRRVISLLLVIAMIASLLSLSIFAAGGYSITVGDASFDSEEDASAAGWSYVAATKTLTLNNYNGASVISGGDLNIVIGGNTVISGTTSAAYNSSVCGISVSGNLNLEIENDAAVSINGAQNAYVRGGDGIVATSLYICSENSSALEICGGDSETATGGFAIKASTLTLETKNLVAKGGNDASALYFVSKLNVKSGCNATFISGRKYVSAITYLSNAEYNVDKNIRSVFSGNGSTVYFSTFGTFTYGDVNLDGFVNAKDAVVLAQFIADWNLGLNEAAISAADVYYDGKINSADAVLLAQYLASWSGITLGK